MKQILKRLFIKLPLYLLYVLIMFTVIIPIIYWVITGKDLGDFTDWIDYL